MKRWIAGTDRRLMLILAALPFAWYWAPVFTQASYYLGDLTAQYEPWWTYGHESLKAGRLPLWNPFVFSGMPYHVNPENSLFYPLKAPLIFLSFFKAAALLRVLNSIVASLGMYLLLRSYRVRALPAFLGAAMFTYGSFMAYEFVHIPYTNTAAWLPWQLLALERLVRRPGFRRSVALAAAVAVSFLGGSPGIFLVCQLTLAFFFVYALIPLVAARDWRRLAAVGTWVGAAALFVIGLSAVLLFPALQFIEFSPRAGGLRGDSNYTDFTLIPQALEALLFPHARGRFGAPFPPVYPIFFLNVPYVGGAAVLLAMFNLVARRHARLVPPVLAMTCSAIFLALGARTGLFPWIVEHVTFFGWFRWPHDYLLMVYFALALTAATGLDTLLRANRRQARRMAWLGLAYLTLAAIRLPGVATFAALAGGGLTLVVAGWFVAPRSLSRSAPRLAMATACLVALVALADLHHQGSRLGLYVDPGNLDSEHKVAARRFLQSRGAGERVAWSAPSAGTHFKGQERVLYAHIPLLEKMPERNARLTDFDRWLRGLDARGWTLRLWERRTRFDNLDASFRDYPVNSAMLHGLEEISGYDPFMIERVRRFYRELPFDRVWNLCGVGHVVTPNRVVHDGLEPVLQAEAIEVYRNRAVLPRVMIPRSFVDGLGERQVLQKLSEPDFDPRELVLLEHELPADWRRGTRFAGEAAEIVARAPERVTVDANLASPGLLVLHDVYYPGWKAYTDGRELDVWRANYIFRAVLLPAGSHRVEFRYEPEVFYRSAAVSAVCWLLCAGVGVAGLFRRGRSA